MCVGRSGQGRSRSAESTCWPPVATRAGERPRWRIVLASGSRLGLGDDPERHPKAGTPLERGHERSLPDRRVAGEPAHPPLVARVEFGRVAQRPVRPDDLVERAALGFKRFLQILKASPRMFLDPAVDWPTRLVIYGSDRGHVDHSAGGNRFSQTDERGGCFLLPRPLPAAPPSLA